MPRRHPACDDPFVGLPLGNGPSGHVPTTSENADAEQVMGRRVLDGLVMNQPSEMGYVCPVCEKSFDIESLMWSEYNSFLWCSFCDLDLPSVLCAPQRGDESRREHAERLTALYLTTVRQAIARTTTNEDRQA